MQPRIDSNLGIQGEPDGWVHSACILCSNGCGLDIAVKDGRIVGVRGTRRSPGQFRPSWSERRARLGRQQLDAPRHDAR